MSAREALAAGASFIVVGRPVIGAADPRAAAEALLTATAD
jgi:orotidine-5'-phosphate decarboxylase